MRYSILAGAILMGSTSMALAVYPSSVIMNAVPALAAGVVSLAIASPPQKEFGGLPHPTILAAARLLGVEEVHAIGGAQATST